MPYHVTVIADFGKYRRGDHVEDDAELAAIEASDHHDKVVRVHWVDPAPVKPAPAEKQKG